MTTTTHNITVEVDWGEGTSVVHGPNGTKTALYDSTLNGLGIHRPAPFVPPFKVGDIIVSCGGTVRIVTATDDEGATLTWPDGKNHVQVFWKAISNYGWKKIGEVTPTP